MSQEMVPPKGGLPLGEVYLPLGGKNPILDYVKTENIMPMEKSAAEKVKNLQMAALAEKKTKLEYELQMYCKVAADVINKGGRSFAVSLRDIASPMFITFQQLAEEQGFKITDLIDESEHDLDDELIEQYRIVFTR